MRKEGRKSEKKLEEMRVDDKKIKKVEKLKCQKLGKSEKYENLIKMCETLGLDSKTFLGVLTVLVLG